MSIPFSRDSGLSYAPKSFWIEWVKLIENVWILVNPSKISRSWASLTINPLESIKGTIYSFETSQRSCPNSSSLSYSSVGYDLYLPFKNEMKSTWCDDMWRDNSGDSNSLKWVGIASTPAALLDGVLVDACISSVIVEDNSKEDTATVRIVFCLLELISEKHLH